MHEHEREQRAHDARLSERRLQHHPAVLTSARQYWVVLGVLYGIRVVRHGEVAARCCRAVRYCRGLQRGGTGSTHLVVEDERGGGRVVYGFSDELRQQPKHEPHVRLKTQRA